MFTLVQKFYSDLMNNPVFSYFCNAQMMQVPSLLAVMISASSLVTATLTMSLLCSLTVASNLGAETLPCRQSHARTLPSAPPVTIPDLKEVDSAVKPFMWAPACLEEFTSIQKSTVIRLINVISIFAHLPL